MMQILRVSPTTGIAFVLSLLIIWRVFNLIHEKNNGNSGTSIISKSELVDDIEKVATVPRYTESEIKMIEKAKKCFRFDRNDRNIELLADIMESQKQPKSGQSIFFHVTSCATTGRVTLNARQACAIESAAKWNPNREIFVLFAAPVGFVQNETQSRIIVALKSYSNVYFRNINLYTYSDKTPAADWITTDRIFLSKYLVSHMSDYLRFLTLFKFGGTYLDLDVVVRKSFDDMPPNYAGAETSVAVAVGAIAFDADDIGHKIAEIAVRENTENFQPNNWGHNGPGVITRVLHSICRREKIADYRPEFCWGFKVFPPSTFYAIQWRQWQQYFDTDPTNVNRTLKLIEDSVAIHLWNKVSSKRKIVKSQPRTVYGAVAQRNCPNAYAASGSYF